MSKYKHILVIGILLIAAGLLEAAVTLNYDRLAAQPVRINEFIQIIPVYNEDGSWLHAVFGIGYVHWLLVLEHILALFAAVLLLRMVAVIRAFYQCSSFGILIADFGIAAAVYRLITRIRGVFVLDYLNFADAGYIYDIIDLYLAVYLFGLLLWMLPVLRSYFLYRKEQVQGMGWKQKLIWELMYTGMLIKASFLPKKKWESVFVSFR